jgi:hypothetical protein
MELKTKIELERQKAADAAREADEYERDLRIRQQFLRAEATLMMQKLTGSPAASAAPPKDTARHALVIQSAARGYLARLALWAALRQGSEQMKVSRKWGREQRRFLELSSEGLSYAHPGSKRGKMLSYERIMHAIPDASPKAWRVVMTDGEVYEFHAQSQAARKAWVRGVTQGKRRRSTTKWTRAVQNARVSQHGERLAPGTFDASALDPNAVHSL